jgi:hypothetical protein
MLDRGAQKSSLRSWKRTRSARQTVASRKATLQRLSELYALDDSTRIFAILRRLWSIDGTSRPLLALLCALARDPLLRATAAAVLPLALGSELQRGAMLATLRHATGERLNDAILDKVARNAASSWAQSGHLVGRVRKVRKRVEPTPYVAAFAAWLGDLAGYGGRELLTSPWFAVLDRGGSELLDLLLRARQMGLIGARIGGDIFEIDFAPLESGSREWGVTTPTSLPRGA